MRRKYLFIFLGIWIGVGLVFWFLEGHELKYDVYSEVTSRDSDSFTTTGPVYRYSEDFSTEGRIIISSVVGLIASLIAVLVLFSIKYIHNKYRKGNRINRQ
jgi:ABC-type polysaccharide transport system permease subunit